LNCSGAEIRSNREVRDGASEKSNREEVVEDLLALAGEVRKANHDEESGTVHSTDRPKPVRTVGYEMLSAHGRVHFKSVVRTKNKAHFDWLIMRFWSKMFLDTLLMSRSSVEGEGYHRGIYVPSIRVDTCGSNGYHIWRHRHLRGLSIDEALFEAASKLTVHASIILRSFSIVGASTKTARAFA
jgi:hypothetical protein